VESIWTLSRSILYEAFDEFVPARRPRFNRQRRKYYPRNIQRTFSWKANIWRLCKLQPSNIELRGRYRLAQSTCRRLLREHELQLEKKVLESGNTGTFYKYVNKKLSCSADIGSLIDYNGNAVVNNDSKANLLNQYFASVCTQDNGKQPKFERQVTSDVNIDTVEFNAQIVYKILRQLKPKRSSGPDGIPGVVLKKLSSSLSAPFAMMFKSFMSVGQVPDDGRSAVVTPLFKKGLPTQCGNYRPVSLTSVVCKIMEKVIVSQMTEYLQKHKIISKQQHGFFSRRSTITNLLETLNDWTLALRNNHRISVTYIDYSKAFDTVSHPHRRTGHGSFGGGGKTKFARILGSRP